MSQDIACEGLFEVFIHEKVQNVGDLAKGFGQCQKSKSSCKEMR